MSNATTIQSAPLMSISKTKELLRILIMCTKHRKQRANAMVYGFAGAGKTQIIAQLVEEMKEEAVANSKEHTYIKEDNAFNESLLDFRMYDERVSLMSEDNIVINMPVERIKTTYNITIDKSTTADDIENIIAMEKLLKSRLKEELEQNDDSGYLHQMIPHVAKRFVDIAERCKSGKRTVLFLDEFTHGRREVHNIFYRVLAERSLTEEVEFNELLTVICASNLDSEDSGLEGLSRPLSMRMTMIINMDTNSDDTINYFLDQRYTDVGAYLAARPKNIYTTNVGVDSEERATCDKDNNPRSFEQMQLYWSNGLKDYVPSEKVKLKHGSIIQDALTCMSNSQTGPELITFMQQKAENVNIDKIISGKDKLPKDRKMRLGIAQEVNFMMEEKLEGLKGKKLEKISEEFGKVIHSWYLVDQSFWTIILKATNESPLLQIALDYGAVLNEEEYNSALIMVM